MRKKLPGLVLVVCCLLNAPAVVAQSVRPQPPAPAARLYNTNTKTDVLVSASGGAVWGLARLIKPKTCLAPCVVGQLNGLDRPFAGRAERSGADRASTVLVATAAGAPFLLNISTSRQDLRPKQYWRDAAVLGETLLITNAITDVVKNATSRPRPFVRGLPDTDSRYGQPASYKSFFSGHTASAFAMTMSYAKMYTRSQPNAKPGLVYGLGIALGAVTGTLRVDAGEHYPTDVIMGALVGSAIGLFVTPALHR
jgi:membrane-associated phospholipid phosphatase